MAVTSLPLSRNEIRERAVDAACGRKKFAADAERVAFLFDLYRRYTSLLPAAPVKSNRRESHHAVSMAPVIRVQAGMTKRG